VQREEGKGNGEKEDTEGERDTEIAPQRQIIAAPTSSNAPILIIFTVREGRSV
jgi:hypothetical protein